MNDNEIKPLYIPESSGNALPNLSKHPAHNETPVPLHRTRAEPSRSMSADPMKYLLPGGAELRDIIRRRLEMMPMSAPALWTVLNQSHQTRPRQEQSVIDAVAGMLTDGEIEQRDGRLRVAEPEAVVPDKPESIDPEMWTMTHTQRVRHVLGTEPMTREALARQTGLQPRQVSKAAYLLIQQGRIEVVGDNPRTWRRIEPKKMDADDVCKAVLAQMGNGLFEPAAVVADISRIADWPHDESTALFDDMLAAGYLVRRDDGRIMSKDAVRPAETEPPGGPAETAMLTEAQTRDVALDRALCACPEGVLVEDVVRLSGWGRDTVAALLETMLRDGDLTRLDDERIIRPSSSYGPLVKSEQPPEYIIGDDDDGEISEPGIARPGSPTYVPDCVTIEFVSRDSGGYIRAEYSVNIDADGLQFGAGEVMPFSVIDAVMPTLRRVHCAVFGGDDETG